MLGTFRMLGTLRERLRRCPNLQSVFECALNGSLELSGAWAGNVQLMNWKAGYLEIMAQYGFHAEFLNFFGRVKMEDGTACARALRNHQSIIIEDVTVDQDFTACLEIARRAGIRAVQSTPLVSSSGALVGIASTHFQMPHRPTDLQMRALQEAAQVTADAIIQFRARACIWSPSNSLSSVVESRKAIARAELLLGRGRDSRIG